MKGGNQLRRKRAAFLLQQSLSALLSKPEATWTLCFLQFPTPPTMELQGEKGPQKIRIEGHVVCVDMVSQQHEISFRLTQGTVASLSEVYDKIYMANWRKCVLCKTRRKEISTEFKKTCSEFIYYTDTIVLQKLQQDGYGNLPAKHHRAAEAAILSLLEKSYAQYNAKYTKAPNESYFSTAYDSRVNVPHNNLDSLAFHPHSVTGLGFPAQFCPPIPIYYRGGYNHTVQLDGYSQTMYSSSSFAGDQVMEFSPGPYPLKLQPLWYFKSRNVELGKLWCFFFLFLYVPQGFVRMK